MSARECMGMLCGGYRVRADECASRSSVETTVLAWQRAPISALDNHWSSRRTIFFIAAHARGPSVLVSFPSRRRMSLPTPTFERRQRWLRPRSALHGAKWDNILHATGTTNSLQEHLVETRLRCITARTWQATRLGGRYGGDLGRLYDSWEKCSRFHSERDGQAHSKIVSKAKLELRSHPDVMRELERHWNLVLATFPKMSQNLPPGKTPGMDLEQYTRWQLCLHKVLSPIGIDGETTFDYDRAEERAAEDYELDLADDELLRKKAFYGALFALADVWTRGVHPGEYAVFLNTLFQSVREEHPDKGNILNELEDIEPLDVAQRTQDRFASIVAATNVPRARPNYNVYKSVTSSSMARVAAITAEREGRLAPPPSAPSPRPPPSPASASSGPALVDGRLRSPRQPRTPGHARSPRHGSQGHAKKAPSWSHTPKWPPDSQQWFLRAQQWFEAHGADESGRAAEGHLEAERHASRPSSARPRSPVALPAPGGYEMRAPSPRPFLTNPRPTTAPLTAPAALRAAVLAPVGPGTPVAAAAPSPAALRPATAAPGARGR